MVFIEIFIYILMVKTFTFAMMLLLEDTFGTI